MFLPDEGLGIWDPVDTDSTFKNPFFFSSSRTKAPLTWKHFRLSEEGTGMGYVTAHSLRIATCSAYLCRAEGIVCTDVPSTSWVIMPGVCWSKGEGEEGGAP